MAIVDDKVGIDMLGRDLVDAATWDARRGKVSLGFYERGGIWGGAPPVGGIGENVKLFLFRQAFAQSPEDLDGVVQLLVCELQADLVPPRSGRQRFLLPVRRVPHDLTEVLTRW